MSNDAGNTIRLTAAILADSATELPATLESLRGAVEELLVIDISAGEEVARVAQSAGARRIAHAFRDDFAAARNAGLAEATGEWVLCLNAGETLAEGQIGAVRSVLALDQERQHGYLVYLQLPPVNPQAATERIAQVRLLPNLPGMRFMGRVRETPTASLAALGLSVELSHVVLVGSSRAHDPQFKRERARRDLQLLDLEIPEKGPQPRLLNALGECHAALGNPQAAREYHLQALAKSARGSTDMLEAYYGLLTSIDDDRHDERLQTCIQALEVFPFDAQLLCAMGSYLQVSGRSDLAARAYESAVRFGQVNPEVWHLSDVGELAALCLSQLWQMAGEDDKARQMLRETLERMPASVRLRKGLIDLEVKYGRVLDALNLVEGLPKDFPYREAYRAAIRGACQAARKNWTAALGYLESALDGGCRDPLCLRWMVASLEAVERHEEAADIARQWLAADAKSVEANRLLREATARAEGRDVRIDAPQPVARSLTPAPARKQDTLAEDA